MKSTQMPKPKISAALIASAVAISLAGCATNKSAQPTEADGLYPVQAHSFSTRLIQKSEAKDEGDKVYKGTGVMVQAPKSTFVKQAGGDVTLNFEGADLREVVKTILSDILRKSYIMDPRVGGTITLHTKRAIPRSAVLPTLETVLRMNEAVLLEQEDGTYQVVPSSMAGKGNLTPQLGTVGKALQGGYSIQVVPLKFIGAADMAKILEPLAVDPADIRPDLLRNLLILSGSEPELRHLMETVDMFDVDWLAGMSVGVFTLQNIDAKTVVADLEKLFGEKGMGPLAGAMRILPLERLNALLVVTPQPKYLDEARTWIDRLDRSGLAGSGQSLYVYQVQNGRAEALADLLNQVMGGKAATKTQPTVAPGVSATEVKSTTTNNQKTTTPATTSKSVSVSGDGSLVSKDVRVIADKDNNALLILASAADYQTIESALRKLDVSPRQVLIEVTIAEVSLTGNLSYGIEWYMQNGLHSSSKLDTGKAGITQLAPGFSFSWASDRGNITAVLNALAEDSKVKVVSSPHITVADNQKAQIQVGYQVPTISQTQSITTSTTGIISSVQYLDTGVMLSVTPHINASGQVSMDIDQEVSDAAKTSSSTIDSPTISKRSAKSTVTVQSGQTLVMAGLISDSNTRSSSGIPLLSKLPLIGALFGAQLDNDVRTELIVLITPRVLANTAQANEITDEYRRRVHSLEDMLSTLHPPQYKYEFNSDNPLPVREEMPLTNTGPVPLKARDDGKDKPADGAK